LVIIIIAPLAVLAIIIVGLLLRWRRRPADGRRGVTGVPRS